MTARSLGDLDDGPRRAVVAAWGNLGPVGDWGRAGGAGDDASRLQIQLLEFLRRRAELA